MTTQSAVLVFPIDISQSQNFSCIAAKLGLRVIAATSEIIDPIKERNGVVRLPYVTAHNFDIELLRLTERENIRLIYAPHIAVWNHILSLKEKHFFPFFIEICNDHPVQEKWEPYSRAYTWSDQCLNSLELVSTPYSDPLQKHIYAGLHRSCSQIPGESDDDKIWLLTQIARYSQRGNVVEIGSAYGRSAYALTLLAKHHSIGSVVCVDPWNYEASKSQGDKAVLINDAVKSVNWDNLFSVFCAELAVFDNVNYIRLPSHLAASIYCDAVKDGFLESPEFGRTPLSEDIAILHIDGNHRYDDVVRDINTWRPFVLPGGWILIDDYLWAFGDGPKVAGDRLLEKIVAKTSFVVGDTLCIQI